MRSYLWAIIALIVMSLTGSSARADEILAATNSSGVVTPFLLVSSTNTLKVWSIATQTVGATAMTNVIDVDATGLTGELCAVTTGNAITCRTRGAVATPTAVAKVEVGLGNQLAYIGTNGDVYMEIGGTFTNITVAGYDFTALAANDHFLCAIADSVGYAICWEDTLMSGRSAATNGTFVGVAVDANFVQLLDDNGAYVGSSLTGNHIVSNSDGGVNAVASDNGNFWYVDGTWTHLSLWTDANGTYVLMGKAGQMQWAAYP